ncbi:MAG: hypothetical protein AVDCRST_MAG49-4275 [uncultured Thermomicrobiales bacterium]|uniref:Uncharacterized protein n=1 Tax=uncultured Thermomicrobiales bacterium TaxID=1645740 RepID=A0A6J4VEY5_9BACT|nr:MAG: hypothetical protein AVDCRST_MAG49-4275 [uncultured Thermomicrobiales bacterium]
MPGVHPFSASAPDEVVGVGRGGHRHQSSPLLGCQTFRSWWGGSAGLRGRRAVAATGTYRSHDRCGSGVSAALALRRR